LSVSLKADRLYIQALGVLAKRRGVTMGELMRQAADSTFGADLNPIVLFFEQSGNQINQSDNHPTDSSEPGVA
jgi:hypothetical protein